jgi:hypothetical protein
MIHGPVNSALVASGTRPDTNTARNKNQDARNANRSGQTTRRPATPTQTLDLQAIKECVIAFFGDFMAHKEHKAQQNRHNQAAQLMGKMNVQPTIRQSKGSGKAKKNRTRTKTHNNKNVHRASLPHPIQKSASIVRVAHTWVAQWVFVQNDHCVFFVCSALLYWHQWRAYGARHPQPVISYNTGQLEVSLCMVGHSGYAVESGYQMRELMDQLRKLAPQEERARIELQEAYRKFNFSGRKNTLRQNRQSIGQLIRQGRRIIKKANNAPMVFDR